MVEVRASPVTFGDVRLRKADFPSITGFLGRLAIGVTRPRHPVQGTMFAGRITAVGRAVTRYAVGDDVFGYTPHGAYAELLAMPEGGAMAKMPAGLTHEEAASMPYGAVTAVRFLRDQARVKPGERVLVLGASGGVGRLAVQVAKHLGAHVTGVCSKRSFDLVRALGADALIDRASEDFTTNGQRYDVIFDLADATTFARSRASLTPEGRFLTVTMSVGVLFEMLVTSLRAGQKVKFAVVMPDQRDMEELRALIERRALRPSIAERFPISRIADAHLAVERGVAAGSVVVTLSPR